MKKTVASCLLAASIAVAPTVALGCSVSKITGTWSVQVVEEQSDDYYPAPPSVKRDDCMFRISRAAERGVAKVTISCSDERLFASARTDFPEIASDHELVKQLEPTIEAPDGTLLPAPNRCEWLLVDRADIDGGEYTIRFGALTSGKMRVFQLSGDGWQDHHFGSTEPKETTAAGILQ